MKTISVNMVLLIVFIDGMCQCSPIYSLHINRTNQIDQNLHQITKSSSKVKFNSNDNSIERIRSEIKHKSCGQILIETLPMICQHSAFIFNSDDNFEYSGKYPEFSSIKLFLNETFLGNISYD